MRPRNQLLCIVATYSIFALFFMPHLKQKPIRWPNPKGISERSKMNQWYVENIMPYLISHGKLIGLIAALIALVVLVILLWVFDDIRKKTKTKD